MCKLFWLPVESQFQHTAEKTAKNPSLAFGFSSDIGLCKLLAYLHLISCALLLHGNDNLLLYTSYCLTALSDVFSSFVTS